jgi:hypothetical protein
MRARICFDSLRIESRGRVKAVSFSISEAIQVKQGT